MPIPIHTYEDVTNYLFPKRRGDFVYNLEKVSALLGRFGDPHLALKGAIVTGSKGKGSVTAMMHNILRCSGNRTGRFTSPHVIRLNERIFIDREIPDRELVALTRKVHSVIEEMAGNPDTTLSFFEIITAMGFMHFASKRCDAVVLEVGMGGRLDSTNVLRNDVAVIMPIELEHTETLGKTIRAIATEKAGVIKSRCDVVANCSEEALGPIRARCRETGSELLRLGVDFDCRRRAHDIEGETLDYISDGMKLEGLRIPLHGAHEVQNATCAIRACISMKERLGLELTENGIRKGLGTVDWPARIQIYRREPLLVIDCAHTPRSAQVLASTLEELFPGKRHHLVAGSLADKDVGGFFAPLKRICERVHIAPVSSPRALAPEKTAAILAGIGIPYDKHASIEEAYACATRASKSVVVTGSIFLAGDVLAMLERRDRPGSVE